MRWQCDNRWIVVVIIVGPSLLFRWEGQILFKKSLSMARQRVWSIPLYEQPWLSKNSLLYIKKWTSHLNMTSSWLCKLYFHQCYNIHLCLISCNCKRFTSIIFFFSLSFGKKWGILTESAKTNDTNVLLYGCNERNNFFHSLKTNVYSPIHVFFTWYLKSTRCPASRF